MSVQETKLAAIADAIREKEGSTGPIPAGDFAARILALPGGSLPDNVRTITVTSSDPEMGTVSGGGVASDGMTVTVKAKPLEKYYFKEWKENNQVVNIDKDYTFEVQKDKELQATFMERQLVAGIDWFESSPQMTNEYSYLNGIAYGNGVFVALEDYFLGSNVAFYSEDGIIWKTATLPKRGRWSLCAYGAGKFIALCSSSSDEHEATCRDGAYSKDGVNWTAFTLPLTSNELNISWYSLFYGGEYFILTSNTTGAPMLRSKDGIKWSRASSINTGGSLAYGNGKYVMTFSYDRNLYYSDDAVTWDSSAIPYAVDEIVYGNGKFFAFRQNEETLSSDDGIVWESLQESVPEHILSVVYGGDKFVAITLQKDKVLYSFDGAIWYETDCPDLGSIWQKICYGKDRFVAVGGKGNAMYSYSN